MNGYEIKQTLKNGGLVTGTLIVSPSPKWSKYISQTGIDFAFIDIEHVLIDSTTLSWMCNLYASKNIAPIVRIPSADPYRATNVIDGGAQGIVVPYMENVEDLKRLSAAVHKKPIKGKKLEDDMSGAVPFKKHVQDYIDQANKNNMLFVNIESLYALEHLDELLAVEGLDGIVIGPNDLSYSMDMPCEYDNPEFERTLTEILKRARAKGVAAGVHFLGDIEHQIRWAEKTGMNMLWHQGDVYIFVNGLKRDIGRFKAEVDKSAKAYKHENIDIEI